MEKKPRKIPKKISKTYLENAALYYLQRYATSAANLKKVLMRKVQRSARHHGQEAEEFVPLVDDLVKRYISSGLLNDASFAQAKTATLRRQGKSQKMIHVKLQAKGLGKADIDAALATVDESAEAEFEAALALARKKKLGPFRAKPADPKKEMAAMGRAGFSYDVAKRALSYKEDENEE
jgi:regulatory protein